MAKQRVYICPEHPEKTYTSWRKFRGHWSTQHRGEECPPREEFLHEMEKEEVIATKKEEKETLKGGGGEEEPEGVPGAFILPEDPVPRLAKILEVHGVTSDLVTQILGVFQIHPGYQNNPVNLHYLLTAKLPRKLHASIPMIISAFTTQDQYYPEGGMPLMMPGMGGSQIMPPYMAGGGYPPYYPYYPPTYGLSPSYRAPIGGREPPEEEAGRGRARERNPVEDAVALLGTLMDLQKKVAGEGEGSSQQVQEIFEGFRATIEEMNKESQAQQDKLLGKIEEAEETRKKDLDAIKDQLHQAEKGRLEDRIDSLEASQAETKSEGLSQLIREAGEGLGSQLEGVRQSISDGADKVGTLAEKLVTVEGPPGGAPAGNKKAKTAADRTISEAAGLAEAEDEVEALARNLEGGSK